MNSPIALNDAQMRLLQRVASTLPVEQRATFLEHVASRLRGQPATPAVEAAVDRVLASMPVYFCDRASIK